MSDITERLVVQEADDGTNLVLGMQFASQEHPLRLVFQHEGHGPPEPLRGALNPLWVTIGGDRRVLFAGDNLDEPEVDRVVLSTSYAVGTDCRLLPVKHWLPVWMSTPEPWMPGEQYKPGPVTAWWLAADRVIHKVETPPLEWGMRWPPDPPELPDRGPQAPGDDSVPVPPTPEEKASSLLSVCQNTSRRLEFAVQTVREVAGSDLGEKTRADLRQALADIEGSAARGRVLLEGGESHK